MTTVDLRLSKEKNKPYDIGLKANGDLDTVDSFDTSLAVSLFAERRADSSEVPAAERRRGWWGNETNNDPTFEIGSKLWIVMAQSRRTSFNLKRAISYAREALQWLIDGGFLRDVRVDGEFTDEGIRLKIDLIRDQNVVDTRYYDLWENSGELIT